MAKRHISILEYFDRLQYEYLLYELRIKIYPSSEDKDKFRKILDFKREKIEDIADKNSLSSIFNSGIKLEEIERKFYNEFGNPTDITRKDKYFYYFLHTDFSYNGSGVKLIKYDLDKGNAEIKHKNGKIEEVDINFIKRIL